MNSFTIQTKSRTDFVNLDQKIGDFLAKTGFSDGVLTLFIPHTTAGITINENADPDVVWDMEKILNKLIPWSDEYRHLEGNSAAHLKSSLMGNSIQVLVSEGKLQLGTWQSIYFCEFDGPRTRKIWLKGISTK